MRSLSNYVGNHDHSPGPKTNSNDEHLRYYHFTGRLLGKALFDRQIVQGHLVRPLYKHLLSWPVGLDDIEHLDAEVLNSMRMLKTMGTEVDTLCLDFTATENVPGAVTTVELKPGGTAIDVTQGNVSEYIDLKMKRCWRGELLSNF